MTNRQLNSNYIFNSPLETGIRSVCILAADPHCSYDLQQLLALDHLVVHTGDLENAPSSLHPNVGQRNGELLVRRPLVEQGLILMEHKMLVNKTVKSKGFYYEATDLSNVFLESLTNNYIGNLFTRARWIVDLYKDKGDNFFSEVFETAFDRWGKEFQIATISTGFNK